MDSELSQIVELFKGAGVGWVFDEDGEARAAQILKEMADVDAHFATLFSVPHEPLLSEALTEPGPMKPVIQAFASPMTTPIRTMVYCVVRGASILRARWEYEAKASSHIEIQVEFPSGEESTFTSDDVWDIEVLRHFGIMKMRDRPVVDGYYAFGQG